MHPWWLHRRPGSWDLVTSLTDNIGRKCGHAYPVPHAGCNADEFILVTTNNDALLQAP